MVISGVIFPLALAAWLSIRLNRAPRPSPRQVGLTLALNGLLPVGLVTLGMALMSDRLGALVWLRGVALAAWIAAGIVLVALLITTVTRRRHHGG